MPTRNNMSCCFGGIFKPIKCISNGNWNYSILYYPKCCGKHHKNIDVSITTMGVDTCCRITAPEAITTDISREL